MQPYYCTLYSHHTCYDRIVELTKQVFPKATITFEKENEFRIIYLELRAGFFKSSRKLKIAYRERVRPSFELTHVECALTNNLFGMTNFVTSLPAQNEHVKSLLIQKIQTLNCEFSVFAEHDSALDFSALVSKLSSELDTVTFAQPDTIISKSSSQHFLNNSLQLILDVTGKSEVDTLSVTINTSVFDNQQAATPDQSDRKKTTEALLTKHGIKINTHLPVIVSEVNVQLRSLSQIKERVVCLALTNLVAFNSINGPQALSIAAQYNLNKFLTPNEFDFLNNPTDERKNNETWKCEGIWTLLWALNIVTDLEFPDHLADLNKIPAELYPILPGKDPNEFINNSAISMRSAKEILNATDLYYRIDWACVNARVKGEELAEVHAGVVYERHYALNWLITYRDQHWDDVSTDT